MLHRDVVIVGAGLAGTVAAILIARRGLRVTLIDPWTEFPPLFRAEKIEPDQAELLRKFGLLDAVLPRTGRIREIIRADRGRERCRRSIEQYGIYYQDLVNPLRAQLPPEVEFKVGRVQTLVADAAAPRVGLADGEEYTARLVVVSCGTGGDLQAQLGVQKRMVQKELSLAFGFVLTRTGGEPFPFDAVTYHPDSIKRRVGYLTLFKIQQALRANLFVYWSAKDPDTRDFIREPTKELDRLLPGLRRVIGEFEVSGRVETCRIDLYRAEDGARPGVVLVADALQSVCPTTGLGLSKVLTDVDVLCQECLPDWLSAPAIGAERIGGFYSHPRKQTVDRNALLSALHGRQIATNRGLEWRLRRLVQRWRWVRGR